LEDIAKANKWKHKTDQYENKDEFTDDSLDNGISKDLEEKDAEIKALREQIEILKNRLVVNPLDANVEEKEEEEPPKEDIIEVVDIDYYKILMQECEDNKTWIEEFMKTIKPKKKLDKKKLNRDIFEIDFMCD
jgi:polyhydroxyalkanoate synthesis regulator phasin